MAAKTLNEAPAFIFKGAVKKMRSATMKEVPLSDRTAVVRVEQVIEGPRSFAHYVGRDITVELAGKKKIAVGDELIFHANSWMFGDGVAVRSVSQDKVRQTFASALKLGGDPAENKKARQLQQRVDESDLVVSGTVSAVTVPPASPAGHSLAAAAQPLVRPVSEHDPKWRQAVIQVHEIHKGTHESKEVTVLFPASTDVRWYRAPKFHAGQKGTFVLHKTKIKTAEHHELHGLAAGPAPEVEVYMALQPNDVHPLKEQAAVKSMIR